MLEELAPGVFINSFYRGCTPGFVYTEEGIILIDAPLIPEQALDWRAQIEDEYQSGKGPEHRVVQSTHGNPSQDKEQGKA